jgi:hypothetical protein
LRDPLSAILSHTFDSEQFEQPIRESVHPPFPMNDVILV